MTSDPSSVITSLSAAALIARYPGNTLEASFVAARLDGWALNDGAEDDGMGPPMDHHADPGRTRGAGDRGRRHCTGGPTAAGLLTQRGGDTPRHRSRTYAAGPRLHGWRMTWGTGPMGHLVCRRRSQTFLRVTMTSYRCAGT